MSKSAEEIRLINKGRAAELDKKGITGWRRCYNCLHGEYRAQANGDGAGIFYCERLDVFYQCGRLTYDCPEFKISRSNLIISSYDKWKEKGNTKWKEKGNTK